MAEILSQDEVNALLRGISSGAIESEKKEENAGGIKPYDLTSQDRIVRGRMPTLEIINERFARLLRNDLTSALRKVAEITSTSVDMQKFGEFLKNIPLPTSLTIFKMPPLRGYAIFYGRKIPSFYFYVQVGSAAEKNIYQVIYQS